jgi:hypothetical protein
VDDKLAPPRGPGILMLGLALTEGLGCARFVASACLNLVNPPAPTKTARRTSEVFGFDLL